METNVNANNLPEAWLSRLEGYDASGWLSAFVATPEKAVNALLWDSFYFGSLSIVNRGQLLLGWLDLLGNTDSFAERLDAELTDWIKHNWGKFERRSQTLVSAWSCLLSVVEASANLHEDSRLKNSAQTLRARFPQSQKFFRSFSTGPAADPLGLYLAVVAEFQDNDRSLATFWHRMTDLPDGVPYYHAPYAILGLRRLAAAEPAEEGTLRAEIVLGLMRLARAFDRLVRTRGLPEPLAKSTFQRLAAETAAAYPNSPGWVSHGLEEALELPERAQKWLVAVVPALNLDRVRRASKTHSHFRGAIKPQPDWPQRAIDLAKRLFQGDFTAVQQAEQLISEERIYAEATGDTIPVVRTLCNLASRAFRHSPDSALAWAEEARRLEPNNDYTWNTVRTLLLKREQFDEALRIAWVAWKRFPEDSVASCGLAEALKATRRYAEAEAIYRLTVDRFPNTDVSWGGLADLLKDTGHFEEAERIYRKAIRERFPEATHLRNGLAETLRRMGRRDEAEAEYRQSIDDGYVDPATYVGLAYLILTKGEAGRAEATDLIGQALKLDPHNFYARAFMREISSEKEGNLEELIDAYEQETSAPITEPEEDEISWEEPEPEEIELSDETAPTESLSEEGEAIIKKHAEAPAEPIKRAETHTSDAKRVGAPADDSARVESKPALAQKTSKTPPSETEKPAVSQEKPVVTQEKQKATEEKKPQVTIEPKKYIVPSYDVLAVAALVAEAYFYRIWAQNQDERVARVRGRKAANLIAKAEKLSPNDDGVLAEKTALSIAEGDTTDGYKNLVVELRSHPAAGPLLLLKARLDREQARKELRPLNDSTLAELCTFPQRLRNLDPVMIPLFHYQRGLAALALSDGDVRKEKAAQAFSRFRRTLAHRAEAEHKDREAARNKHLAMVPRFHEWLQEQVNTRVFAELPESEEFNVAPSDIPSLEEMWKERRFVLENVEDVFVDRLAFRTI
jgi:tetratricopeptide (TPR) repeat protein